MVSFPETSLEEEVRFLAAGQETTHMDKNISREDGKMDN